MSEEMECAIVSLCRTTLLTRELRQDTMLTKRGTSIFIGNPDCTGLSREKLFNTLIRYSEHLNDKEYVIRIKYTELSVQCCKRRNIGIS